MGNFIEALCIDCKENLEIDGFRCFECSLDHDYSDELDLELTLDWTE